MAKYSDPDNFLDTSKVGEGSVREALAAAAQGGAGFTVYRDASTGWEYVVGARTFRAINPKTVEAGRKGGLFNGETIVVSPDVLGELRDAVLHGDDPKYTGIAYLNKGETAFK